MKVNNAYSALGGVFEYLNNDCGYEQWSQYLINKLSGYPAGSAGLDMGCGNGYFTRALYRAGYKMTGMDISPEMLSKAVEIARGEGVRAEFLLGDITKFAPQSKYEFVVAVNDCINYVPQEKLKTAFTKVYKSLKKGGTFIFDISSENKLKNIIGNNVFADDRENLTVLWFNKLFDNRVEMDVTLFSRLAGGEYSRQDERHVQYIHKEEKLNDILGAIGFFVECEGHLGGSKEERINFICKK